ncbi:hypothetical protein ACFLZB_00715 [Nanoarchaeota archaeon]
MLSDEFPGPPTEYSSEEDSKLDTELEPLKDEEILEILRREIKDNDGYLKSLKYFDGNLVNEADLISGFIKIGDDIGAGAQYFVLEGEIDFDKARKHQAFKKIFANTLAHKLAAKDNLEEQIEGLKEKLSISWDDITRIRIDDDLVANLRLKEKLDDKIVADFNLKRKKRNLDLLLGYNLREVRRVKEDPEKGKDYLKQAWDLIENNDQDTIDYLIKCGVFKKDDQFNDQTMERVAMKELRKRGISKDGKCVIKISRDPVKITQKSKEDYLQAITRDPKRKQRHLKPEKASFRSRREANFVGLMHEGAVPIFLTGYAYQNRVIYISKLFKKNQTRKEMIQNSDIEKSLQIAHHLSRMLCFYNRLGVVNRDIKPDNIMYDGQEIQMNDFGLAGYFLEDVTKKGTTLLTGDGQVLGTPPYMPFEQTQSKRTAVKIKGKTMMVADTDIKADIYSTIGTLYELLTGKPPNIREGEFDFAALISPERPTPKTSELKQFYLEKKDWADKSRWVSDYYQDQAEQWAHDFVLVMAGGLVFNRDERYENPEQLRDDLQSIINLERPEHILGILKRRKTKERSYLPKAFKYWTKKDLRKRIAGINSVHKSEQVMIDKLTQRVSEEYQHQEHRPTHFWRKLRQCTEMAAGVLTTVAYTFPQLIDKGYELIQKLT